MIHNIRCFKNNQWQFYSLIKIFKILPLINVFTPQQVDSVCEVVQYMESPRTILLFFSVILYLLLTLTPTAQIGTQPPPTGSSASTPGSPGTAKTTTMSTKGTAQPFPSSTASPITQGTGEAHTTHPAQRTTVEGGTDHIGGKIPQRT
jgi:hypothetical protein